jgi:hypothetical protein
VLAPDVKERVVIDKATNLMWHQSGSQKFVNWEKAKEWVNNLSYFGYDDWRLPTLEEAISLLEKEKQKNKRFIDTAEFIPGWHVS